MDKEEENGASTELNPPSVRTVKLLGIVSISDWIIFAAGALVVAMVLMFGWGGINDSDVLGLVKRVGIAAAILIPWAAFSFIQDKARGKLRTRMFRFIRSCFLKKVIAGPELRHVFSIKEIVNINSIHYHTAVDDGYATIYRLNGFNPTLLQHSERDEALQNLIKLFEAKFRFKIISCEINYKIPQKKFRNKSVYPGIFFAEQTYSDAMKNINTSTSLKERAYFVVVESSSIKVNVDNMELLQSQGAAAHTPLRPATSNEMEQLINKFWFDGYTPSTPNKLNVKKVVINNDMIQATKHDGSHEYTAIRTYTALPERGVVYWLYELFNSSEFDLIADFNDVTPTDAVKHIQEMDNAADSLIQTKWFKKRASDVERLRIQKVKGEVQQLNEQLVNAAVGMKQTMFYMMFKGQTRKELKKKIADFKARLYAFNTGWILFDCKYLQFDAFLSTRIWDIPSLVFKKTSVNSLASAKNLAASAGFAVAAGSSSPNHLPIVREIDHYLLTTSIGIGCPFMIKTAAPTNNSWYKGMDKTSSQPVPFFNDYWKVNEMYNSFNRFYQGRNGSGKSASANLDMIQDRLDNKFIISVDPKPERVTLTRNLGGENIFIGANDEHATFINIFDVLVVPQVENDGSSSDPLSSQYQANLSAIATLTSLNVDNPNDKLLLSLFNDVQQIVYEKIHGFTSHTNFERVPKNQMPIMREFYDVILNEAKRSYDQTRKVAFEKLSILIKEHAIGISSHLFNKYSNVDWGKNNMWNFIVRDIALNYGNKNILATWVNNIVRVATSFMLANKGLVLYIDELHLIHSIPGVLQKLDEFARIDRSFKSALCLINQNFNSIKSDADPKKKEYYQSIFAMSQYNLFFTTSEEDVDFLIQMLSSSGNPLSEEERRYMTAAGQGKALLLMTAYDRYKVQFDISFWKGFWDEDLVSNALESYENIKQQYALQDLIDGVAVGQEPDAYERYLSIQNAVANAKNELAEEGVMVGKLSAQNLVEGNIPKQSVALQQQTQNINVVQQSEFKPVVNMPKPNFVQNTNASDTPVVKEQQAAPIQQSQPEQLQQQFFNSEQTPPPASIEKNQTSNKKSSPWDRFNKN